MKHNNRLRPAALVASFFAMTLCAALNTAPVYAAETSRSSERATSELSWLPENESATPALSTSPRSLETGDRFLVSEGKASYYANRFHGKKTASGEFFSLTQFTAAHRTLPFGTNVRVTNLDNGKDVVVRINDRGPHLRGRIIDVSPAAAREIGLVDRGAAHVRIEAYD